MSYSFMWREKECRPTHVLKCSFDRPLQTDNRALFYRENINENVAAKRLNSSSIFYAIKSDTHVRILKIYRWLTVDGRIDVIFNQIVANTSFVGKIIEDISHQPQVLETKNERLFKMISKPQWPLCGFTSRIFNLALMSPLAKLEQI